MKKKIWAICLTLVLALAAFAISGCSLFNNAGTISWVKEPQKVYSLSSQTNLNDLSFELKVQLKDSSEEITVSYPTTDATEKAKITVKGFDTTRTGTYTATVTYDGKLSLSFSYKVTDAKYADGTGISSDPYMISNTTQFQNMLKEESFKYYKLANNIDFTGTAIRMANKGVAATDAEAWVGELDGNNYIVSGINKVLTVDGVESNKYNEIFGKVARDGSKFVLKNITFDFASDGSSATMGLVTCNGTKGVLEYTNVNVTGYLNASNTSNSYIAPYASFLQRSYASGYLLGSITLVNCTSSIKIHNSYAIDYVSGFIAVGDHAPAGPVSLTGCKFTGLIEGAKTCAGAIVVNSETATSAYTFSGCSVEGAKIYQTAGLDVESGIPAHQKSGKVAIKGARTDEEVPGIAGDVNKLIDISLKVVDVKVDGVKLTAKVKDETLVADNYKIFAFGSMAYSIGGSGNFKFVQPVDEKNISNGVLTQDLLKIKLDAEGTTTNTDESYGTRLIVRNADNTLTYFGKSAFCNKLTMKPISNTSEHSQVIVVAYKNGKAVAIGTATRIDLEA